MTLKRIKDPIYGYVEIEYELFQNFIDTAEFQRLRMVRQTGYSPLYPAALHNRFIHSIGVYYLGCRAIAALDGSVKKQYNEGEYAAFLKKKLFFERACLLHDFGHSPFSHAGENFYRVDGSLDSISEDLADRVGDEGFRSDMKHWMENGKEANPHEIMSALLALSTWPERFVASRDRAFFARCITGYVHLDVSSAEKGLENAMISILNSSSIDVDKLDYLIRDSFVAGYDSIVLDYERLLRSFTLCRGGGHDCQIAYHKSALSVLENVVYARDLEKKWVQSHPVVLYEGFLVDRLIRAVVGSVEERGNSRLFSKEALSSGGTVLSSDRVIRLLCDDDLISIGKNELWKTSEVSEYFDRKSRRHPAWKSEAEYFALFKGDTAKDLSGWFALLERELSEKYGYALMDNESLKDVRARLAQLEESALDDRDKTQQETKLKGFVGILECLKDFSEKATGVDSFDFVLSSTQSFKSGFYDGALEEALVYFPHFTKGQEYRKLGDIITMPRVNPLQKDIRTFYLYYRREDGCQGAEVSPLDISTLATALMRVIQGLPDFARL